MRYPLLACLFVAVYASLAQAQVRRPPRPPVYQLPSVSPYINLLRSTGESPAVLYQGIIRPQLQANRFRQMQQQEIERLATRQRRANQELQNRIQLQGQAIDDINRSLGRKRIETGHATYFMNTGVYFPLMQQQPQ